MHGSRLPVHMIGEVMDFRIQNGFPKVKLTVVYITCAKFKTGIDTVKYIFNV